jgi:uncharacterized protein YjbJ (UPF0337 family)
MTIGRRPGTRPAVLFWNVRGRFAVVMAIEPSHERTQKMNKDRIEGSAEQAKGKVKEVAGKVTGDSKLETEGKADQVAGKVKNTVGGLKDAVKEAVGD